MYVSFVYRRTKKDKEMDIFNEEGPRHTIPVDWGSHYTPTECAVYTSSPERFAAVMSEGPRKPKRKFAATRRLLIKGKLLKKAASMLVAENEEKELEKERVVNESVPPLKLSGLSVQELQELCKELHQKLDVVDEMRYDMQVKVNKNENEIVSLKQKIIELKGIKKPSLKRVKKTTDDMLGAYIDASKLKKADFKANLKTVKKEDDKKEEVTDWRKNVEALSGMEGRKKLFTAGQ